MHELTRTLTGDGVAAPAVDILDGIGETLVHQRFLNVPHTIFEEVWHLDFWQRLSLAWIAGSPVAYPLHAAEGFPLAGEVEGWESLRSRFAGDLGRAAALAADAAMVARKIACPSLKYPERVMTVGEQLWSLAAHNAYHLGRIVLLRQMDGGWPPPSGGNA